jgi:hypothetical protein
LSNNENDDIFNYSENIKFSVLACLAGVIQVPAAANLVGSQP